MSVINTGRFDLFCEQWKCTHEEIKLLLIYLAVIKLKSQLESLQQQFDHRFMVDGEGI